MLQAAYSDIVKAISMNQIIIGIINDPFFP